MKKTIGILSMLAAILAVLFVFNHKPKQIIIVNQEQQNQQNSQSSNVPSKDFSKDTIPGMSQKEFKGDDLQIIKTITENEAYTRYQISYKSEGLKISGVLNVPKGEGPFPVIIMNHGYLDPEVYKNGDGLPRELDYFPRHGYVVLHPDYRNYALSDFDPNNEVRPRSGYVEDVLNAVSAIKNSNLPYINKDKIVMFGHSMGGGITINIMVTKPDTAMAYVLYAPINANYKENFERWVAPVWPDIAQQFYDIYGTPEENPNFWRDISAINFLDKINKPIMLHQGTSDIEVPVQWSRDLNSNLRSKNKEITYYEYAGEPHVFSKTSDQLMLDRSLEFFNTTLK